MWSDEDLAAARKIAKELAEFRQEVVDKIRSDMELDLTKMETEDFDPARGRGRGPRWLGE